MSRFEELLRSLADEDDRRFTLAELNDLLAGLTCAEFPNAVSSAPDLCLSAFWRN